MIRLFLIGFILLVHTSVSGQRKNKIQLAILIDISGSMQPVIDQTTAEVWRIANYLNTARKNDKKAIVEVALLSYGGEDPQPDNSYVQIRSPFTTEIDSIASRLLALEANGGNEYSWKAIDIALSELRWSRSEDDLKIIVIAGNEVFNYGDFDSKPIIKSANKKYVGLSMIYCETTYADQTKSWQAAAGSSGGNYFFLPMRDTSARESTFLEYPLIDFNRKLNLTYLPYGPSGQRHFKRMIQQDKSTMMLGIQYFRDRIFFKASPGYRNPSWDLVDAFEADSTILIRPIKDLPGEISWLIRPAQEDYLRDMKYKRDNIRQAINMRYEFIKKYIDVNNKSIDAMIIQIAQKAGEKKGFSFTVK